MVSVEDAIVRVNPVVPPAVVELIGVGDVAVVALLEEDSAALMVVAAVVVVVVVPSAMLLQSSWSHLYVTSRDTSGNQPSQRTICS